MKDVIILGGGASVTEGIEMGLWDIIKGKEIWSLNFAYKAMPYLPTREVWVDTTFWKNNTDELESINKRGVQCHAKKNDRYNMISDIIQHDTSRKPDDKNKLFIGAMGLCGLFALALAIQEKYERIFLLGYDWGTPVRSNTHTHFYQGMSGITYQSRGVGRPDVYIQDNSNPKNGVRDFDAFKNHKEIYNVSIISHITSFPKLKYEEFYERLKA